MGVRKSAKLSDLTQEDEEHPNNKELINKNDLRRERNKKAAAKIRKKMQDRTSALMQEAAEEERKQQDLMSRMTCLLNASQELTSLLQGHQFFCQNSNSQVDQDPSTSPCNGTSNTDGNSPRNDCDIVHTGTNNSPSNLFSNITCGGPSNSPSNDHSQIVHSGPSISPSDLFSNVDCTDSNSNISNDRSNGSSNSVVVAEKKCEPGKPRRPNSLALGDTTSSNNTSNLCSNSSNNSVVVEEKRGLGRPRRPTTLSIGDMSSSNDDGSNNNNLQKTDCNRPNTLDLSCNTQVETEYKTVETPAFMKSVPGSAELDISTPSDKFTKLNFESMMEGGTGLTPVSNPTKTFCSYS